LYVLLYANELKMIGNPANSYQDFHRIIVDITLV
jgi:hypothetical protein